jgi:large subunit ribosomal protein L22
MAVTHTNERPGTRAVLRHFHMSASKARQVLDLVRGVDVVRAQEILANTPREAADVVAKVLASAAANAMNNDGQALEELYITSAFADEGSTTKRFRPRARGRAGRIRKRSCHITIIVARMDEVQLARARSTRSTEGSSRSRRVAGSRRRADQQSHAHRREVAREEAADAAAEAAATEAAAEAAVEHESDDEVADRDETTPAVLDEAEGAPESGGPPADADDDAADATVEAAADAEAAPAEGAAHDEDDTAAAGEEHTD